MADDREQPNKIHQMFFRLLSLAGPRLQGRLLRRYFDLWHLRPDPWGVTVDAYERDKYATTLKLVPAGTYRRILDLGCSEGSFTMLASAAHPAAEAVGVDISERALRRARERAGQTGSRARFVQLDILTDDPGDSYDLVFCGEVLYYLGHTRTVADRLATLVEPGGFLVLTHSRPQARLLHPHFAAHPQLKEVVSADGEHDGRSYSVAVYTRSAP